MTFISTLLKAAAALFMLVILMLLVQLDLTAFQTVEVLAPGWGWLAFVSLLALEAGAVLWLGLPGLPVRPVWSCVTILRRRTVRPLPVNWNVV